MDFEDYNTELIQKCPTIYNIRTVEQKLKMVELYHSSSFKKNASLFERETGIGRNSITRWSKAEQTEIKT